MRDVTLKQLRSLAAVVEAGTVAGAAARLHVTAPAVAQQLRLLERSTGLPLFERTDLGIRATEAGRELIEATGRIEAELARCGRVIDGIQDGSGGHVVFGAVSTAKYFAPMLLATFWSGHPGIDVQLRIGNRQQTVEDLEAHRVDLVIMGRPPASLDVEIEPIGPHPHVVVAAPDHPLAGEAGVSLAQLAKHPVLVREHGSGTRLLVDELFERRRTRWRVGMEISSNETIKQAAMAGLGVALISAHTVAAEVADGRLAVLDVDGLPLVRQWYVVRRADHRLLPAARTMWAFLVEHAADHLPALP